MEAARAGWSGTEMAGRLVLSDMRRLVPPDMRRHVPAGMRAVLVVLVAAAVALTAGCADSGGRSGTHSGGGNGSSATASTPGLGRLWQVTQIRHAGQTFTPAPTVRATLQLTADGTYLADDSVNAISGTYRGSTSGFRTTRAASTLVGYAGSDPARLAVIAAMAALTSGSSASAQAKDGILTITVSGYELTFRDIGPAVTHPPASPTPTAVSTT